MECEASRKRTDLAVERDNSLAYYLFLDSYPVVTNN